MMLATERLLVCSGRPSRFSRCCASALLERYGREAIETSFDAILDTTLQALKAGPDAGGRTVAVPFEIYTRESL